MKDQYPREIFRNPKSVDREIRERQALLHFSNILQDWWPAAFHFGDCKVWIERRPVVSYHVVADNGKEVLSWPLVSVPRTIWVRAAEAEIIREKVAGGGGGSALEKLVESL